jgi:endothelin-converting enzyme/putative endopeptidase
MAGLRMSLVTLAIVCLLTLANAQQPAIEKAQPALDVTSMDRSIDPCVDFFAYSCGGWLKRNPIPPDQSSWDTYSKMQDENLGRLRAILEAAATADKRNAVDQRIGDYYASCTDEKAIDAQGAAPLKPLLERIAKIGAKAEIAEVAAGMIDDNVLFHFESIQDFRDANQVIANADQGGRTMRSLWNCASSIWRTCRKCLSFSATSPKPPQPRHKP